jgi:myo-inositol-1(or 4)-monophosphatase
MSDKYFIEQLSAAIKGVVNIVARDLREVGGLQGSRPGVITEFVKRSYCKVARVINRELVNISKLYEVIIPEKIVLYAEGHRKLIATDAISNEENTDSDPGQMLGTFIINPIGGMTNFARAISLLNIDISVQDVREGEHFSTVSHAVMYNMNENIFITATVSNGAYADNGRIKVSETSKIGNIYAIIEGFESAVRFGDRAIINKELLLSLKNISIRFASNLKLNNTALALAYLACGKVDLVIDLDLNDPIEIAAGFCIAKEAGAVITTIDGRSSDMKDIAQDRAFIASNGMLHGEIISKLKGLSV